MIRALVVLAVFASDLPPPPDALLAVDTVPTPPQLDAIFGDPSAAATSLENYATAPVDVGVRLHAIHGLVLYCTAPCATGDPVHDAVASVLAAEAAARDGADALVLRAALESLGAMGDADDVSAIATQLAHPSRDIRAAAARALAAIGDCGAVPPLRSRAAEETIPQVQLAIADALRILSPPKCP